MKNIKLRVYWQITKPMTSFIEKQNTGFSYVANNDKDEYWIISFAEGIEIERIWTQYFPLYTEKNIEIPIQTWKFPLEKEFLMKCWTSINSKGIHIDTFTTYMNGHVEFNQTCTPIIGRYYYFRYLPSNMMSHSIGTCYEYFVQHG